MTSWQFIQIHSNCLREHKQIERSTEASSTPQNSRMEDPDSKILQLAPNESFHTSSAAKQAGMSWIKADTAISDVSLLFNGGIYWDMKAGNYRQYFRLQHPRESFTGTQFEKLRCRDIIKINSTPIRRGLLYDSKDVRGRKDTDFDAHFQSSLLACYSIFHFRKTWVAYECLFTCHSELFQFSPGSGNWKIKCLRKRQCFFAMTVAPTSALSWVLNIKTGFRIPFIRHWAASSGWNGHAEYKYPCGFGTFWFLRFERERFFWMR